MRHARVTSSLPLLLLLALLLQGCGKKDANDPLTTKVSAELGEIFEMYRMATKEKNKPPTGVADFKRWIAGFPLGYQAVDSGKCVVFWGTNLADASASRSQVLAYETDVPTQGGAVLMNDGQIKIMTAEEFKGTPKGKS